MRSTVRTRPQKKDAPISTLREQMQCDLHDLCQPLTALQFQLEMGHLIQGPEALQKALSGSLEETRRLFEVVAAMRNHLLLDKTEQE